MWFIEAKYIFMFFICLIKVNERIYFLKKRAYENNEIYNLFINEDKHEFPLNIYTYSCNVQLILIK